MLIPKARSIARTWVHEHADSEPALVVFFHSSDIRPGQMSSVSPGSSGKN